jgi:putative membrane protein
MKTVTRVAFVLGLVTLTLLVLRNDAGAIFGLLSHAGWLLFCLIPLHCIVLGLDVRGWQLLILERSQLYSLFAIACVREAVNRLLPVANIGGELVGARLLVRCGVRYPAAISSIIVETILNLLAQVLFLLLGVICLLHLSEHCALTTAIIVGATGVATIALVCFWSLRRGVFFTLLGRLGARLAGSRPTYLTAANMLPKLDSSTRELTADHLRLTRSLCWQLCGLISGSAETWVILRWLGQPLGAEAAVALESVTLAARSIFFIAPAGLGVQEAGLIGLGSLLGLCREVALALSLAKRGRELAFGLPVLVAWQLTGRCSK